MIIGLAAAAVNKALDAVKQKRRQVKQAKYPVRVLFPMPDVVLRIIPVVF
jgi:hypothetical protein